MISDKHTRHHRPLILLMGLLELASFSWLGCSGTPASIAGRAGEPRANAAEAPLADRYARIPVQHFVKARGRGANAEAARSDARRRLLEKIQASLRAARCEGAGCFGGITTRLPPFKHGALVNVEDPVAAPGGFAALATLRRDAVQPYLEEDIRKLQERLDAWRRPMTPMPGSTTCGRVLAPTSRNADHPRRRR